MPKKQNSLEAVCIRLPKELVETLDKHASTLGITRSEAVRDLLQRDDVQRRVNAAKNIRSILTVIVREGLT